MNPSRTAIPTRTYLVGGIALGGVAGVLLGLALSTVAPVVGVVEPGTAVRLGIPLVRVLLDLTAVAVVGLSLLPKLLGFDRPKQTEPVLLVARPAAVVAAGVWAMSALVAIVLQAAEVRPGETVTMGAVLDYVRQVSGGQGLLVSAVFALLSAGLGVLAVRHGESVPAELRIVVAMFGLLPLPVTGHASNWKYHDLTMVSMELHVLSATAWTGGLAALIVLVSHRRGLLAAALPKFSRVATVCLAVVAVTGLLNGLIELALNPVVHLPGSLLSTGYGTIVVAKTVCVAVLALLGAAIRWRLLPGIARHRPTAIVGWAAAETAVMGVAFGLAVVLSRAPVS
ncbi:copper resistance protein CopD [Solihabitans fulvus]|uniref:Copper resistance protein CopD n=1 Tax=Solihabitans fulvus TaxID=1892852 RepID=A0A5B2XIQ8_9PSEU|nr:CopD family protein [Solihabitans fulvus]KAA2263717.1 copper resistance protein CopD [Solihabitans fulvus]